MHFSIQQLLSLELIPYLFTTISDDIVVCDSPLTNYFQAVQLDLKAVAMNHH